MKRPLPSVKAFHVVDHMEWRSPAATDGDFPARKCKHVTKSNVISPFLIWSNVKQLHWSYVAQEEELFFDEAYLFWGLVFWYNLARQDGVTRKSNHSDMKIGRFIVNSCTKHFKLLFIARFASE